MKKFSNWLVAVTMIIIFLCSCGTPAYAATKATKNGIVYIDDVNFRFYKNGKMVTGFVKYKGNTYYFHKTGNGDFRKGEASRNRCRIIKGKFYYFDIYGRMIKRNTHYRASFYEIDKKKGYVKYIYKVRGSNRGCRYNCLKRCLEWEQDNGTWKKDKKKGIYLWPNTDLQK